MCGLAGRFHPDALPAEPAWPARVAALLAHRGPDGRGHYQDEHCELVHRRLALIDLSPTGEQPMANEDNGVYVVFNGEIYNHRELRRQLAGRGHCFRGTSDTEVLVHLYEDLGRRMVDELRGIFAFAVYDRRQRRLLLARDRYGVKPLFYATHDGQWVFASEIKAIRALARFHQTIDRQACYDFLGLGYVPEPATGFGNIAALPRGTTLAITRDGHRLETYYQVAVAPRQKPDLATAVDAVEERLLDAVRRQSVADVPVAALLSGGIDSSLVVAAHARATGERTTTFNVRFPDRGFDETATALAVSRHCGTQHHTIDLGHSEIAPDSLLDLFRHFDQPFADTSLVPMYWISRAVRERGIICTLSGDGGDEAFGGYERFWRLNRLATLMRCPDRLLGFVEAAGAWATRRTRDWGRQLAKAARLGRAGRANPAMLLAGLDNYLTEAEKEEVVFPDARAGLAPVYRHFDGHDDAARTDLEELSRRSTQVCYDLGLPSDMLRKVDMMSMRASIEVRVPLLDEEIVALGVGLPHRLKTDGRTGKLVLRALAGRWLPPHVAAHPKQGFAIPFDVMLTEGVHEALADLLLGAGARTRGVFARSLVEHWLRAFRHAGTGNGGAPSGTVSRGGLKQRVFTALALELWLRAQNLAW